MQSIQFSLEVFPAKTLKAEEQLLSLVNDFSSLNPEFISITCGANGSEFQELTRTATKEIRQFASCPAVPHITGIGHTKQTMKQLLDYYANLGISQVLLLRGDMPKNNLPSIPSIATDFPYALDLIEFVKKDYDFEIFSAAYPETHPEALSSEFEINYLKAKVEAGASKIITQFFMDPEVFLRFRDKLSAKGIDAELIPGILPILNFKKIKEFATNCGADIPKFLDKMFDGVEVNSLDHRLLTMNILSHQITRLIEAKVNNFHLYTLNQTMITKHLCIWLKSAF